MKPINDGTFIARNVRRFMPYNNSAVVLTMNKRMKITFKFFFSRFRTSPAPAMKREKL
jgi:hypothetical protein